MTRYLLENVLCFPSLNLGEGATPVEINGYLLSGNWVKGLFPVPVGHRFCVVLQLSAGLQLGRTKFYRWKCSCLCYFCAVLRVSSARPSSAKRAP